MNGPKRQRKGAKKWNRDVIRHIGDRVQEKRMSTGVVVHGECHCAVTIVGCRRSAKATDLGRSIAPIKSHRINNRIQVCVLRAVVAVSEVVTFVLVKHLPQLRSWDRVLRQW